jgi:hypothetical protein
MQKDHTPLTDLIISWVDEHIGIKRAILIIIGLVVLTFSGISLFHTPRHEIIYGTRMISCTTSDGTQITICILDMGNTGQEAQCVEFRLRSEPLRQAVIQPSIRNYGVRERPMTVSTEGDTIIYRTEPIQPDMIVEFRFVLSVPAGQPVPSWDELLAELRPEKGRCLKGSPGSTKFMRFFYSFL